MPRSEEDQVRARTAMREIMLATPYIASLDITVEQWAPDGVRLRVPFAERLTNGGGAYHGGAVASLIDTAGAAAVWAGHDFDRGARAATISMTVNYVGSSPYADLVAEARCVKRGRDLSFAEITVSDPDGKALAVASMVYRIVE